VNSIPSSSTKVPLVRRSSDTARPVPTPVTIPPTRNTSQPERVESDKGSSSQFHFLIIIYSLLMLDLIVRGPIEGSEGGVENLMGRLNGVRHITSQLL
jgi:hypothetical protein